MKSLKKIAAVALAGVMALGVFSACGSETASLADKLNDVGYNLTYSSENSADAAAAYDTLNELVQVNTDYDEDIENILDSRNYADLDDDEKQDYLGAAVEYTRKYYAALEKWPFAVKVDIDEDGELETVSLERAIEAGMGDDWWDAFEVTADYVYIETSTTEYKDLKADDFVEMVKTATNDSGKIVPVKGTFGYHAQPIGDALTGDEYYPGAKTILVCVVI